MDYLQKWWEEKYPNAGVEKIINVSEGIIDIEHLIDFEQWIVKKLIIPDVVASVLCVSDETDCINLTKGKKYTLIESDNIFFRVVNDLGNEQLYYNYRFKRL